MGKAARTDVRDQVFLITGAARGIGAELARTFAGLGAKVALVGLEPDELAVQAKACGPQAAWWVADVTRSEQITDVAQQVRDHFGRIDVVVANAGVATGGTLRLADAEAYDRVVEVNLLGSIRTARAVLPHLIETQGYYFQIASLAALLPAAVMASYAASKSGVEAFAHSIKAEFKIHGVDVGIGYPSWIDTDMVRGADEIPSLRAARTRMPWPLNLTFPLPDAVAKLSKGILARKAHVMYPGWLWVLYAGRAGAPTVAALISGRFARISETTAAANPDEYRGLAGAGGAADTSTS